MMEKKLSKLFVAGVTCAMALAPAAEGFADSGTGSTMTTPDQACKGKNSCKGKGGCKTDTHACKGQNSCKGQGGCKTRPMNDMMAAKRADCVK